MTSVNFFVFFFKSSVQNFSKFKMSRIPSRIPQTRPIKVEKAKTSVVQLPPGQAAGTTLARVRPSASTSQGPSLLQKRVFKEALSKSALDPKKKVRATGASSATIQPPTTRTRRGEERVLQQVTLEKTVQRTPRAEYIGKRMVGVDVDKSGRAKQIEITSQEIDPAHATESAGVNATISVTSSVSVTSGGRQVKKSIKKRTVTNRQALEKPNLNPAHVSRLVIEEVEDVENTLKMVPPELITQSIDKYPLKKKVHNLRLNAESIAVLEQAVIYPAPTADEVDIEETSPDVMATVIEALEKGATPNAAPNQIFNTLFPEVKEQRIDVSSVAPGPLKDIVVPTASPKKMTDEIFNEEMDQTIQEVQLEHELPADDVCTENDIKAPERTSKAEHKKPAMLLEAEAAPWESSVVQKISNLVGGDPIDELEPMDTSTMETSQVVEELSHGIDYFVDADTCPYQTRVQIRGSKLPDWFPGYMSAFPHLPELVKISRSPSGVLHSAWKAVQPKLFPEDAVLIA